MGFLLLLFALFSSSAFAAEPASILPLHASNPSRHSSRSAGARLHGPDRNLQKQLALGKLANFNHAEKSAGRSASAACTLVEITLPGNLQGILESACTIGEYIPEFTDPIPAKAYSVKLEAASVLHAEITPGQFDIALLVFDPENQLVAFADEGLRGGKETLNVHLPSGTYSLIIIGSQTGSFAFTSSREDVRACSAETLTFDSEISGTLSDKDCRWLDLAPYSQDSAYLDRYTLEVKETTIVALRMSSSDASAFMGVLEPAGDFFTTGGNGGSTASVTASLTPGKYEVLVSTYQGATMGTYRMSSTTEASRTCAVRTLRAGDSASGEFAAADCRYLDLVAPSDDDTFVHVYRAEIPLDGLFTASMASTAVDSTLKYYDAKGQFLGSNNNASRNVKDSKLAMSLRAGPMYVYAGQMSPLAGTYQLSAQWEELRPCAVNDLAIPGSATGSVETTACRRLDFIVPSGQTVPVQPFRLTLNKRQVVTIDSSSQLFDVVTALLDRNKLTFAIDDDGSGGTDSRLDVLLEPGDYYALIYPATSATGAFTINTATRDPRVCASLPLTFEVETSAALAATDCRLREVLASNTINSRADVYDLKAGEAQKIKLLVSSEVFEPLMIVLDKDRKVIASSLMTGTASSNGVATTTAINGATVTNTIDFVATGDYTVIVSNIDIASGAYKLMATLQQ